MLNLVSHPRPLTLRNRDQCLKLSRQDANTGDQTRAPKPETDRKKKTEDREVEERGQSYVLKSTYLHVRRYPRTTTLWQPILAALVRGPKWTFAESESIDWLSGRWKMRWGRFGGPR